MGPEIGDLQVRRDSVALENVVGRMLTYAALWTDGAVSLFQLGVQIRVEADAVTGAELCQRTTMGPREFGSGLMDLRREVV